METVVAILLTTIFISLSLQGLVVAKLIQSQAMRLADAQRWVQADMEAFRAQLSGDKFNPSDVFAYCQPQQPLESFAAVARDRLAGAKIASIEDYELPLQSIVTRGGHKLQVARTLTIPPAHQNPHYQLLGIRYRVLSTPEKPLLTIYTEVLPDVALECP
jgi:hypothetical protein